MNRFASLPQRARSALRLLSGRETAPVGSWQVGLVKGGLGDTLFNWPPEDSTIHWITGPTNGYWADPFLVERAPGDLWLFCEQELWGEGRGTLVAMPINPQTGQPGQVQEVLRQPFHLSYPNVFSWNNRWYALPEQAFSNRVELYEIRNFPGDWQSAGILLDDYSGIDPTLHHDDNGWWMFVNSFEDWRGTLAIFHATELTGPWTPHPVSPLVCDDKGHRMAGAIFSDSKRSLWRLSQDCAEHYGQAIWINAIEELDQTRYCESRHRRIVPQPHWALSEGLHHASSAGGWMAFDVKGTVQRKMGRQEILREFRRRLTN